MDAAYNGKFHIKFFDFFDIIYRVDPNKTTSLVWGQWDLNPAGKWVQLHIALIGINTL
jgi:hypothetical protein